MNPNMAITPEVRLLIESVCDGAADDVQVCRLESLLMTDVEACNYYVDLLNLDAELQWLSGSRQQGDAAVQRLITTNSAPPQIPALEGFSSAWYGATSYVSSGWPVAYLVATVIFGVGLLIGAIVHVSQPGQCVDRRNSATVPNSQSPIPNPSSVVARITGMVDCVWEGSGFRGQGAREGDLPSPVHGRGAGGEGGVKFGAVANPLLHLGDTLALRSGLLEITYDTGAKVILQGPVTYAVDSPVGGYLAVGKLTAKLEKKSEVRGQKAESTNQKSEIRNHRSPDLCPLTSDLFAIRTPTTLVTDLGTEFGVEVNDEGATDTRVFTGRVQVAVTSANGNGQTRMILAGQSAHVGKDLTLSTDLRDSQAHANRFVRTMPDRVTATDTYANLVLSMNPVVYYRMDKWPKDDRTASYVLVDSAPGGHHGVANPDNAFGNPSCQGKCGRAMTLHGSMSSDHAFVRDYPKTDTGQLSAFAWVWSITDGAWGQVVGNWLASLDPVLTTVGQFTLAVNPVGELSVEVRQADGVAVNVRELDKPLPIGQWQHVGFVADGAVLHLYRNGVEIGATPYVGIASAPLPKCLGIGCQMDVDGTGPRHGDSFAWNGRLDEIAVFNHALSLEQVRRLYGAASAAAKKRTSR